MGSEMHNAPAAHMHSESNFTPNRKSHSEAWTWSDMVGSVGIRISSNQPLSTGILFSFRMNLPIGMITWGIFILSALNSECLCPCKHNYYEKGDCNIMSNNSDMQNFSPYKQTNKQTHFCWHKQKLVNVSTMSGWSKMKWHGNIQHTCDWWICCRQRSRLSRQWSRTCVLALSCVSTVSSWGRAKSRQACWERDWCNAPEL